MDELFSITLLIVETGHAMSMCRSLKILTSKKSPLNLGISTQVRLWLGRHCCWETR